MKKLLVVVIVLAFVVPCLAQAETHVSPTSYTVKFEYSVTGGPWTVFGESKDTKVK